MPHYYFDIKDGHRFVDPSGSDLINDDAAIAKAKLLAIGISIDKPAVDPKRHIAVLNGLREEISGCPFIRNHQSAATSHSTVAMILLVGPRGAANPVSNAEKLGATRPI